MMKAFVLATIFYFASSLLTSYAFAQPISAAAAKICSGYQQLSNQNNCLSRLAGKKLDADVPRICENFNQPNNRENCAVSLVGANIADGVVQICTHWQQANNIQNCALYLRDVYYLDPYAMAACETYTQPNNIQNCALALANAEYEPVYGNRCLEKYTQGNNRQACLKPLGSQGLRAQAASINTCAEYTAFAGQLRAEYDADDETRAEIIRQVLTHLNAKFSICVMGVGPSPGAFLDPAAAGIN